ncbi:MAG: glycine cleavage system aminomethyltransferase GcvT [Proteobacteria bacterium]|nr:glycine cleavage system aminomethyltransferase GcvT [Pseudomonadota bacterium]
MAETPATQTLKFTPLSDWHAAHGARMVPFAGYSMPVQYPAGIIAEHTFTRESAGLFDVSHMGQAHVHSSDWETTARALEALVPADVLNLKPGQIRYSQLTNADGGTLDDLMITRSAAPGYEGWAYLVVNAGCKDYDYEHIAAHLNPAVSLKVEEHVALVALQGPAAVAVLGDLIPAVKDLAFMTSVGVTFEGHHLHISRSGYTGEDGFEISVPNTFVVAFWEKLLSDARVKPIGLGARDSLRLEAGLSLYGHELDTTISPVEAGLKWSIQKRRREEGGFPGAARILKELKEGPSRIICGIKPEGRQPARENTEVMKDGRLIGRLTSGGFGPSVGGPVALGLIEAQFATPGTDLVLIVRGKELPAKVVSLPFVPHRYIR